MVNRRSAPWLARILLIVTSVVALMAPAAGRAAAQETPAAAVFAAAAPPIDTNVPVDTANPFLPENRDVTDCVGTVQRPGCGSAARGGWHQNLVAIAMIGGLFIVFGRVAWVVIRAQRRATAAGEQPVIGDVDREPH